MLAIYCPLDQRLHPKSINSISDRWDLPSIELALTPTNHAKYSKALWLYPQGYVEVLTNSIDRERHARPGPAKEHSSGQSLDGLSPIRVPYLREELDAPTHGPDETEDRGCGRYACLGRHIDRHDTLAVLMRTYVSVVSGFEPT